MVNPNNFLTPEEKQRRERDRERAKQKWALKARELEERREKEKKEAERLAVSEPRGSGKIDGLSFENAKHDTGRDETSEGFQTNRSVGGKLDKLTRTRLLHVTV
ncbi:hypothetical protein BYT27DRAFT_7209405 [Phlegmacium glaucopus]|nr:hypothetical protein BYT27DRAFT_7209405 [Phlegmacium glaucopus]